MLNVEDCGLARQPVRKELYQTDIRACLLNVWAVKVGDPGAGIVDVLIEGAPAGLAKHFVNDGIFAAGQRCGSRCHGSTSPHM